MTHLLGAHWLSCHLKCFKTAFPVRSLVAKQHAINKLPLANYHFRKYVTLYMIILSNPYLYCIFLA